MKNLIFPGIVLSGFVMMSSCGVEMDGAKRQQLADSIQINYPGIQAVHIKPEDQENLIVVLGDKSLYETPAEVKQQLAVNIGKFALEICGKDSYLRKGRLVLTKDIRNVSDEPKDGIVTEINIDSLKKAMFK